MLRCKLILLVLVSLQSFASAEPPATAPASRPAIESNPVEKDGVSITVSLQQRTIPADEQPQFVVRFHNTSADYVNLYDIDAFWDWKIQFTRVDRQADQPGPWQLRLDKIANWYPIAHKQIKAGESLEVAVNLNDPPFTFDFAYQGPMDRLVAPVRHLSPGTYRMEVTVSLANPFGPGHHLWEGPLTTDSVELKLGETAANEGKSHPTPRQISEYDEAIDRVTKSFEPGGRWLNGGFPAIKLPADAKPEDIIASAVNMHLLESKAYRILRIRHLDHSRGNMTAALVRVGAKTKVLVFFPTERAGWWTRFYDTDLISPATQPATHG